MQESTKSKEVKWPSMPERDPNYHKDPNYHQVPQFVSAEASNLLKHYSVGRLYKAENGRLGLNGHEFHCGEVFEIFKTIPNQPEGRWAEVRIEHSACWYLVGDGRQGNELLGLIARRHR